MLRSLTISILLITTSIFSVAEETKQDSSSDAKPRHVILIIGDGMDDHQITIARNYLVGASGHLALDQMALRSTSQILTTEDKSDGKPVYVADSANTATTMATGVITSRGRIATAPGSNKAIVTIAELAQAAGYRTGIVSTASVTDATPAAFAAHISFRMCENPDVMPDVSYKDIHIGDCIDEMKTHGGTGSISEQLAESALDVLLGGGSKHFAPTAEGSSDSVRQLAESNGFQVVTTVAELQAAEIGRRTLGLFSESTMPVRLRGENGRAAEAPEPSLLNYVHQYLGDVTQPEIMNCEPNPGFASTPSLKQMADAALAHLSHENERGFFLMIESASIDKESHKRHPCGSIGEVEQLNEALTSALDFARENPRTLILVTADHSQAAQLIPNESLFAEFPIPVYSPGKLARIRTPEGGIMAVNYATNNFFMEEHTGANVPLFANDEGLGRVPAFIQQPQIFTISRDYLGL
ncbi:MAG: alkaline phosphatase [Halieaceae bacterium]|jgi:alkaline phosphatase|nr:alkaline phosphatase [Halieaceae bacterium]